MNLFPIQILATDTYGWADSSDLAKSLWKSRNNKCESWYGISITINSYESVTIYVHDMVSLCDGGIGGVFKTIDISVSEFTNVERKIFDDILMKRYNEIAFEEYNCKQEEAKRNAILKIRKEMFGV